MLALLFVVAAGLFVVAYFVYGRFMSRLYELDDTHKTPAYELNDGMDYCPAPPAVLLGHHFASIAGAGPIVGPIAAAGAFGWLPVYLWCVIGSIFLGGPHDMGAVVSSIRHKGLSIAEVIEHYVGGRAKTLFLGFMWLTLILIIAVFLQLAANTFANEPAVAFSGTIYILFAVVFGVLVYRFHLPLWLMSLIMIPLVLGAVVYGLEADWVQTAFNFDMATWRWLLVGYIFLASVLPVWLLLQPRDYLASYLLYFALIVGSVGMVFGGSRFTVELAAYKSFAPKELYYLWPLLFVTVACGAISGFHCMVASGTTAKQLRKETDAQKIGYGAMLIEGIVAVIALGIVMIAKPEAGEDPLATFGRGFGMLASVLGIDPVLGKTLGLLAVNSFILTTLDTATRLSRYQLQELSNMRLDRYTATIIGVAVAVALLFFKTGDTPAWKVIWPIFGASNQLVAAMALLTLVVWVTKGLRKSAAFLRYPMYFMIATTFAALILLVVGQFRGNTTHPNYPLVGIAIALLVLAVMLMVEAYRALKRPLSESAE